MKHTLFGSILPLAFSLLISSPVHAEEVSLDKLLQQVRGGLAQDRKENRTRLTQFKADKAQQAKQLKILKANEAQEEKTSAALEARFTKNEARLVELERKLNERLGTLKELFGVLQQSASDARVAMADSLTHIQFAERDTLLSGFVSEMEQASRLPDLAEIESLWFELQREMTESGKVVRFTSRVVDADGVARDAELIRVGAFNLVADGRYYQFFRETGRIVEYPRQPSPRHLQGAETLSKTNTPGSSIAFSIDPSRGQLLALLVQTPELRERIEQGGVIAYIILGLGALAMLVALERLITLSIVQIRIGSQAKHLDQPTANPLGRVLAVYHNNRHLDGETLELKLSESILKESLKVQKRISFIKIVAVVAPLLGLLGTVTGMIITFQAITLFGAGDPKLMSGGISQALVTTVLGLTVAIPSLLLHALVQGRAKQIAEVLEQQAVGMVVEQAEAQAMQSAQDAPA